MPDVMIPKRVESKAPSDPRPSATVDVSASVDHGSQSPSSVAGDACIGSWPVRSTQVRTSSSVIRCRPEK